MHLADKDLYVFDFYDATKGCFGLQSNKLVASIEHWTERSDSVHKTSI